MRILLLLCAALGVGILWLTHDAEPPPPVGQTSPTPAVERVRADLQQGDSPETDAVRKAGPTRRLEPGERVLVVHGEVLLADGSPAGYARVLIQPVIETPGTWWTDTDGSGRFTQEVSGDAPSWQVTASIESGSTTSIRVALPRSDPVVLRLPPSPTIRGRVLDPAGRPIAGQVHVSWKDERGRGQQRTWSTAADGSFAVAPPAAQRHVVSAHSNAHYASRPQPVDLEGGDAHCVLQLRGTTWLHGIVLRADGTAEPDIQVEVYAKSDVGDHEADPKIHNYFPGMPYYLRTTEEGVFRCAVPDGVRLRVVAHPRGVWSLPTAVADDVVPGSPVRIVVPDLQLQGRARVRVLEPDGSPAQIKSASVSIEIEGHKAARSLRLDSSGGLFDPEHRGDQPGTLKIDKLPLTLPFKLAVTADGWPGIQFGPWLAGRAATHHTVHLPALASIACQMVTEDGAPAAFVVVKARASEPYPTSRRSQLTDAQGMCRFEKLLPGAWTVREKNTSEGSGETVRLAPGETRHVTLRVPAQEISHSPEEK